MTDQFEEKRRAPLRPISTLPPIVDQARFDPRGEACVEVSDLCDRTGIRYRVTGGYPPLVMLRGGGGHVRTKLATGRDCFVVDVSALPPADPERSMLILELLVRGFDCYQAVRNVCNRGYFSPDISLTYSGKVIIEGDDR